MTKPPIFPKGWRVLPCVANGKNPLLDDWPSLATDDPKQIEAWFVQFPHANWAVAMGASGLAALDADGEEGLFNLSLLDLPETRIHETPRGCHLIFSDREHKLAISAGKIAPKLDTRGGANNKESYIVIPPSKIGANSYSVLEDRPLAPVPDLLVEAVGKAPEAVAAPEGIEFDDPQNVARAQKLLADYVARGDIAIEGHGGDTRTYQIAAEVQSLGLSGAKTYEVMQPWNDACNPPWSPEDLRVKIENARAYMQNEAGACAVPPLTEWLNPQTLERLKAEAPEPARAAIEVPPVENKWAFSLYDPVTDANLRPIEYRDALKLWPDSPGFTVTQVIAGPKCHKTNFIMAEMFRLAFPRSVP